MAALASSTTVQASAVTVAMLVVTTTTLLLLLQLSAAELPLSAPAQVGLPGCNTSCGGVQVPYPFGFGPARCYWPGLNLTCDSTRSPGRPWLLLGDGTLRVTEISLVNNTVRVVGKAGFLVGPDHSDKITYGHWNSYPFGRSFGDYGYTLSFRNELFLCGCNMVATLLGDTTGQGKLEMLGGCASFCDWGMCLPFKNTGDRPCCEAPLSWMSSLPIELRISSLYIGRQTEATTNGRQVAVQALVAEEGWGSRVAAEQAGEGPLILQWAVTQGLDQPQPQPQLQQDECPDDVRRKLCKSQHSDCIALDHSHYTCQCQQGYGGNPYLAGGCQDIDECRLPSEAIGCISGECINTIGSFYCGCPPGSYGNPYVSGGCVVKNSSTGSSTDALLASTTPMIGLPGCNTTCGKVQVPYPFGFGPARCYWPGFNLTCDTSHDPPPLLLGDGTLQVVNISLTHSTVRVIRNLNTPTLYMNGTGYSFDLPNISEPYSLSSRNEFVLNACGWQATLRLQLQSGGGGDHHNISVVVLNSNCSNMSSAGGPGWPVGKDYCSGTNGCCHAPISAGSTPMNVTFQVLKPDPVPLGPHNTPSGMFIYAFLTEGLSSMDHQHQHMNLNREINATYKQMSSPLVLQWAVKQGFPAPDTMLGATCPSDVAPRLCKSNHSNCRQEHGGYTCQCTQGYVGNPYITDGCKDIDECEIPRIRNACFGHCNNLVGSYTCRCPRGTHGNPSSLNGCRPSRVTGLSMGIGVGSGAGFILLVLVVIYVIKKLKHRRSMKLKQKFFKQNRGQLLQQLVAHRADIAERMIITLEELEKATNKFDKARELGGGGHGTVYMGILSNQHFVAIKKSNISVQREIDEFINEVAILSQIRHRNVVKLYGCCLETKVPLLVYEFVSNGTLYSHLHVEGAMSLSWKDRLRIATETAKAIAYLHSAVSIPIIHRDIKSTNILLDDTLTSKVADFGASRHIPIDRTRVTTNVQGTIGYLDPTYYCTGWLTEKSDVFSFGVLLVELLTRKTPYSRVSADGRGLVAHFVTLHTSSSLVDILDQQVMQEGGNQQATEVAALAVRCVKISEDERPTMRQVEMTLEAIQANEQTSDNSTAETFENSIRRRFPSDPKGRSLQNMTRQYSLEEELSLSASFPR
ncbi:hypothetical protein BS78_06G070900 [Paspalum vaginatum]|nr:hypothetical protein BS78_06G070900 [Paspalum vaginatum]